ncbi:MATE family efflux transporter [Acidaminobacterium chupaoyuni]
MRLILLFSVPLLIGNVFQQFYSMADTVIVGRTLGVNALAAVGATGAISFLILGFAQGLTGGFAVMASQQFGAGDEEGLRRSVATSVWLCLAATLVITALAVFTARPLLRLMNTPADIIEQAYQYIVVIYYGIGATVFYNMSSGLIRAVGDSRTPLYFLVIACLINVVLDYALIIWGKMGVAGAGWATVAAQLLAGFLCLGFILKKLPLLCPKAQDWRFDFSLAEAHLRVGLPMAFQFSITAVGVMILQTALNACGSTAVAAFTAGSKIENLATQPVVTLGATMATYAAQNYGAGQVERIRQGVKKSAFLSLCFSLVGGVMVTAFCKPLVAFFVGEGQAEVAAMAQTYLNIVAPFFFILGMLFIYRNTLQGMGLGGVPILAGVSELFVRVLAAVWLVKRWGYAGVCWASSIAWILAAGLLFAGYAAAMQRLKKYGAANG